MARFDLAGNQLPDTIPTARTSQGTGQSQTISGSGQTVRLAHSSSRRGEGSVNFTNEDTSVSSDDIKGWITAIVVGLVIGIPATFYVMNFLLPAQPLFAGLYVVIGGIIGLTSRLAGNNNAYARSGVTIFVMVAAFVVAHLMFAGAYMGANPDHFRTPEGESQSFFEGFPTALQQLNSIHWICVLLSIPVAAAAAFAAKSE